ncbi:MAG: PAS domain S-box protein [Spirochaetales bacterium]|nr:PAS domain S-box protein [Spirochaetales bacterium]
MEKKERLIRILFIDPDHTHSSYFIRLVKESGHQITCFPVFSFQEAKKRLDSDSFDIVIGNYNLDNTTILDLSPFIGKTPLVITGSIERSSDLVKALESGAEDYVIKDDRNIYCKTLLIKVIKIIRTKILKGYVVKSRVDELLYRDIMENIPDIIYKIDPNGFFTYINSAVKMLGYTQNELIGKHFRKILHPEDYHKVSRKEAEMNNYTLNDPLQGPPKFFDERRRGERKTTGLEVRLIPKTWSKQTADSMVIIGSVISFGEINAQGHYKPEDNRFLGTIGIIHDITTRRKSESLLRKLYEAVDHSPLSIIITDSNGNIEYVNPFFIHLTNYTPGEIIGKHISQFSGNGKKDGKQPDYRSIITTGERFQGEVVSSRKNGDTYWESVTMTPIRDPNGKVTNYVIIKMDISSYKKAQIELQNAHDELDRRVTERTQELQKTNETLRLEIADHSRAEEEKIKLENQLRQTHRLEMIGTLAGGIAHDFNNILAPIIGFTEMILEDIPEDDPVSTNLTYVLEAANRAKDLVQQILTFSRQVEHEAVPVMVQPLIKELLKLLRATIPKTISIKHYISPRCGAVMIDPTHFYQIIMNLCTNAFHAMREAGGTLEINLNPEKISIEKARSIAELKHGDYLSIKVKDTGHGMERAVLDRIFDPFFTTKKVGEGSGLGLSVVHGIVTSYGGAILVESEVGVGTTFTVYLPRIDSEVLVGTEKKPNIPRGTERILFVDDEKQIALMGKEMLERLGYEVTMLTDSEKALDYFKANAASIDLLVTDQTMPGMTGARLAVECMRIKPGLPVILITGFSEQITDEESKKIGIREYVMKPIAFREISQAIRRALEMKEK